MDLPDFSFAGRNLHGLAVRPVKPAMRHSPDTPARSSLTEHGEMHDRYQGTFFKMPKRTKRAITRAASTAHSSSDGPHRFPFGDASLCELIQVSLLQIQAKMVMVYLENPTPVKGS
jgi:hypothetical protein